MTGQEQQTTVGQLPTPTSSESRVPAALTRLVWALWVVSLGALAVQGWTGFIKQRAADDGEWQSVYPISLSGYLAARLALLDAVGVDIEPLAESATDENAADELAEAFLNAWEATYREDLVGAVSAESRSLAESEPSGRPDAQMVFCIDTRSEIIRHHIEAAGDYETHGYAGFFGIPMEYEGYESEVSVDACPPIVEPQHRITDYPREQKTHANYDRVMSIREAAAEAIETLETDFSHD